MLLTFSSPFNICARILRRVYLYDIYMVIRIIQLAFKDHLAVQMIKKNPTATNVLKCYKCNNHIIDRSWSEFTHTKNISFEYCQWPYLGWYKKMFDWIWLTINYPIRITKTVCVWERWDYELTMWADWFLRLLTLCWIIRFILSYCPFSA